jgi:Zn-dependent metalloprotease
VLTARDADDRYLFSPEEVAKLYYETLRRLDPLATFEKVRSVLLDVARTYYGVPAARSKKTAAIAAAYAEVEIGAGK